MTILELLNKKRELEENLHEINNQLCKTEGLPYVENALYNAESVDLASSLANEINQRDYPMTREKIRNIFQTSGFVFNETHIDLCNPDSEERVKEEIEYFRRNEL